jgi:oligosaccharyltransferase complex subunit alpha (ribophorin I)
VVAEDFTIKIVLPSGATDISVNLPFPMDTSEKTVHKYLDIRPDGRRELVLHKKIVSQYHNDEIAIIYRLAPSDTFTKPLVLVFYCFCIFLALMVYFRMSSKVKTD